VFGDGSTPCRTAALIAEIGQIVQGAWHLFVSPLLLTELQFCSILAVEFLEQVKPSSSYLTGTRAKQSLSITHHLICQHNMYK